VTSKPFADFMTRIALACIPAIVLVAVWYAALRYGSPYLRQFLPWPGETLLEFVRLIGTGELLVHAASSLRRVLTGVTLAAVVGIPLGIVMGAFRIGEQIFNPTFEFLRPIPIAAWVPLSMMLFGIGEAPALALIFLGALYPIVLSARDGVRYVDPIHLRAAGMLGANSFQTLVRVILPSAVPHIVTGIRQALGIGWWVVILAELLAVRSGIGYMMVIAQQTWQPATIISGMIAVGIIGLLINRLAGAAESHLLRWRA
jgi:ABC-type nitrate/sulfonate/bicarbonate transport system permease component